MTFEDRMELRDLPQFAIERVRDAETNPRLVGRLSHLRGVQEGRSWLYAAGESVIGDLEDLDTVTGTAVFWAPYWTPGSPAQPGAALPWLDGYWQVYHVSMIVDPTNTWRRAEFVASDAQYFELDGHRGWQKVGQGLLDGAVPREVVRGGWDHEHCELCRAHIGAAGAPAGYVDVEERWLCEACYRRYAEPRDLSFLAAT
jgi:hypothetical protein